MSFYDASVPAFLQILGSLSGLLSKAEAHCKAKNIQPDVLLGARLYPDMLPLSRQIQLACDFAAKGRARLAHVLPKRKLEIGFGVYLLLVSARFAASLLAV